MLPRPHSSDTVLWNAFREGQQSALDTIYQNLIRPLYQYGSKLTPNQALVEDCIQDMFVELWERRERLGPTDSIKFYLFKVLRRTIMRRLRQNKATVTKPTFSNDALAVEESAEFNLIIAQSLAQRKSAIQKAIDQLADRQREVIYLRFYDELDFEEIARIMDIEVKSVYKLTYKAIHSLKGYLSPRRILIPTLLLLILLMAF